MFRNSGDNSDNANNPLSDNQVTALYQYMSTERQRLQNEMRQLEGVIGADKALDIRQQIERAAESHKSETTNSNRP